MDIMPYTERRQGLILTLFWSSCVLSSWYVILGNGTDGTHYTQWLLSNKHIFPLNTEEQHLFCEHGRCFNGVLLPYNCEATTSQVVPWPYPWDVSEVEARPWCRTPLAVEVVTLAAWTKYTLLVQELVDWTEKLRWQYQRDGFSSWNSVAIFFIILHQKHRGLGFFTYWLP